MLYLICELYAYFFQLYFVRAIIAFRKSLDHFQSLNIAHYRHCFVNFKAQLLTQVFQNFIFCNETSRRRSGRFSTFSVFLVKVLQKLCIFFILRTFSLFFYILKRILFIFNVAYSRDESDVFVCAFR